MNRIQPILRVRQPQEYIGLFRLPSTNTILSCGMAERASEIWREPVLFCSCLTNLFYDPYTYLIQQPHRQHNQRQREDVRRWSNNGCHHEDNHDSMFAVAAHEIGGEETQFGKQPRENRNFEDQTHRQRHSHQSGDVGLQSDHVVHFAADLIGSQETERQRKDQKVAHRHTQSKHRISASDHPHHILPLIDIQSGRHEAEQLIEDIRQRTEDSGT